ncbi:MAG: GlxA family transcriptional regulator [Kiloniellales bacterium]
MPSLRQPPEPPPLEVTVVLTDATYGSTALGPIEVFHSAGLLWNALKGETPEPRFRVTVASIDGTGVTCPYAVGLTPQCSIRAIERTDIVVIPASGQDLELQLARHRALFPWLRDWHAKGAVVAGICTGAAYLAEAGLLDGRKATTHWAMAERFRQRYPKVDWQPELFITEDERLLCSGGVYAAIDLSLYLVEKLCGHEVALKCAKALLVDMPRSHQSGYAVLPLSRPHSDGKIRLIELYIERHYASELSIEGLAGRAHMSPRNFIRRFKAATGRLPRHYLQAQRVAVAKELLEQGARSVQGVSEAVGYKDVTFFRGLFKRHTGMTPVEYRSRFSALAQRSVARRPTRNAASDVA